MRIQPIKEKTPILFMSSNGTGVGHLTRLMAMARQSSNDVVPLFLTLSQAIKVVEDSGFYAEYLPSSGYLNMSQVSYWHLLLEDRLNEIIHLYRPKAIVFDGTHPYRGLQNVLEQNKQIKSVWSRRAMWKNLDSPIASNLKKVSEAFDLVIEPGEVSSEIDDGPTVQERANAYLVNPITYLDRSELLPKKEARKRLGLSQDGTIGLVQLGAGNINDTSSTLGTILNTYKDTQNLKICVSKSVISNRSSSDNFPNVVGISYYPLSECLNAFDFAIGAAGYNTFHEFINFEVPSLIIPNTHATVDDALKRIKIPEDNGAILVANEGNVTDIANKAKSLLDTKVRQGLRTEMRKLQQPNGARDAILKIESLIKEVKV